MPEAVGLDSGGGGAVDAQPAMVPVTVEPCTCGCTGEPEQPAPEWPLAQAWQWLTRPVEPSPEPVDEAPLDEAPVEDGARVPWWDARASAGRRRAVLPLVLLAELQAGVLARAVWQVLRQRSGGSA